MLTTVDILGLFSAVVPWMQRAQMRRLERIGARVPFSIDSRAAIARACEIARAEGVQSVDPVHLAMAALEVDSQVIPIAADVVGRQATAEKTHEATAPLPFTYAAFVVLVEAVRVAADSHRPHATPDHLLLGILRKRPRRAIAFLTARGVTSADFAGIRRGVVPRRP